MRFWSAIRTGYAGFVFLAMFLFLFPLFFIIIQKRKWRKYGYHINRLWADIYFRAIFKKIEIEIDPRIGKNEVCIYCPNHFSYLDIPMMGYAPNNFIFVGKSSLKKIPLFGYMFDRLHITVNRESKTDSYKTYERCKTVVGNGRSLVIFPEGGIITKNPPKMGRFKDGAFRIAIEQQIPVIPVTIPFNWILLPVGEPVKLRKGKAKVIFHEPIPTEGMSLEDVPTLRNKVFNIIEKELNFQNNEG